MARNWKDDLEAALEREDHAAILVEARQQVGRVIRLLNGRLYSGDAEQKWRAIRALGALVENRELVDDRRTMDLLRRFVWALNDESGAVPYGIPEAIGEVLAVRPEFQEAFLPILCSLLIEEDMSQTGPVESGALWAVGRVGQPVAEYSSKVVSTVRAAAQRHPEARTREVAAQALERIVR
ncbi:MAG: hypothetical protein GY953_35065 [bacterium]|nr:hypothetical protein [bacterium]